MLHKIGDSNLDEIDFGKALVISGFLYVQDANDVLVVEVAQELHFTQRSQAKHAMIERRDFLDGNLLPRRLVKRGAVQCRVSFRATPILPQIGRTTRHRRRPLRQHRESRIDR
jgi:hypothetical protein